MLYYLLYEVLQKYFSPLNVFRYITVRTVYASLTAMFLSFVFGPVADPAAARIADRAVHSRRGAEGSSEKGGTPTMGGVLIVLSTLIPSLLWADLRNRFVLLVMFALLAFAAIGFIDDYAKVAKKQNLGLTSKKKFLLQILVSFVVGIGLLSLATRAVYSTQLVVPVLQAPASGSGDSLAAVVALFLAPGVRAVSAFCVDGDCGGFERGEFDGRAGWVGDRVHGDRGGRTDGADLREQQLPLGDVSRHRLHPGRRRVDRVLRSAGWSFAGISLVQRASGRSVHGRCGVACRWAARWA